MRMNYFYPPITSVFLVLLVLFLFPHSIRGGGMMAVSQNDEESSKESAENPNKLSDVKVKNHIKIAQSHINEAPIDTETYIVDEEPADNLKIKIKDKSPQLQDPAKHTSDIWLINFLIAQYNLSTIDEKVDILQNLENYCHKLENGIDLFSTTNVIDDILLPAINSSNDKEIKLGALRIIAIASQNNHQVKQLVIGTIRYLIQLTSDSQPSVRSASLFAISSIIRNNIEGQIKFIQDGGISTLLKGTSSYLETNRRILRLITDLLNERFLCRQDKTTTTHNKMIECDHSNILENSLEFNGWCSSVLFDSLKNITGFDDDDQITIIEAISASLNLNICSDKLSETYYLFKKLLFKFQSLQDEDFLDVVKSLQNILSKLHKLNDEL